jgi:hypothetical protein
MSLEVDVSKDRRVSCDQKNDRNRRGSCASKDSLSKIKEIAVRKADKAAVT